MKQFFLLSAVMALLLLTSCSRKPDSSEETKKVDPVEIPEPKIIITPSQQNPTDSSQTIDQPVLSAPEEEAAIEPAIQDIPQIETPALKLARAALERTMYDVTYDGSYRKIAYPMGDVPETIGVCTDVVIRSYRQLGIDLQQKVHEDMRAHFSSYPNQKRWGLKKPDTNIDHRRVPNLQVFFSRHGQSLPVSGRPQDYQPGDIVTWKLNEKMLHIGIVAEQVADENRKRHLIIHNIGRGPELGDMLFDFEITGHYRYPIDTNNSDRGAEIIDSLSSN